MSRRSERPLTALLLLLAANALAGCGGGGGSGPPPGNMTTTISKTAAASGDAQTATVGQPLADPIRAVVTDAGEPAPDVSVSWSTTVAGGVLSPASGNTDANGIASSTWALGTVSGAQTARATVSGASGSPVTFMATALPDAATALLPASGDGQTGDINTQLAQPVQARVTDQFGNGVEGTSVSWDATGATVSAPEVVSNAAGISQVSVTLGGTAGLITITAEAVGLAGSPLSFSATAVTPVPAPNLITVTVGNNFFRSNRNGTTNPAVDTVAVDGTVTWRWVNTGQTAHNVDSDGSPSFPSSVVMASGEYSFAFSTAGTYQYTCAIHPGQMTGRIVVR